MVTLFKSALHATPVRALIPANVNEGESPEGLRIREEGAVSPLIAIPVHKASPCPKRRLWSPAISLRGILSNAYSKEAVKRSGHITSESLGREKPSPVERPERVCMPYFIP